MRLLTKTTLYFLMVTVPLLATGGFYLYRQVSEELNKKTDEELISEELHWIDYLKSETRNGTTFILRTPDLLIFPTDDTPTELPSIVTTTPANSKLVYRQLSQVVIIYGIPYQVVIRRSQQQNALMRAKIVRIMLLVFIGLLLTTLYLNWVVSKSLWRPFRQSLEKIRHAELQKMAAVHFERTSIVEFNELNASLNAMVAKIHNDFVNMKEFTENAAHEMQTPLAVVQSKLELLLQDTNLTDTQVDFVIQASTALSRLSKLNQSLLLLAKIENNQYQATEPVDLTAVADKYLQLFNEVITDKQVKVEKDFSSQFLVPLHPLLADSLVSNLVGNAVKYNYKQGMVSLQATATTFSISNTSNLNPIESGKVFKRFASAQSDPSSNGLGLAIVKKICDAGHLSIQYSFSNGVHKFEISRSG